MSLPARASAERCDSSAAMARMDLELTACRTGTRRPVGVSIAMAMLWVGRRVRVGGGGGEGSVGGGGRSMRALRMGKSLRARETALMMNGRAESFVGGGGLLGAWWWGWALSSLRSAVRAVRLYSSA